MGRFDGKAAIVTGGAMGIGGASARKLAADGARVLIVDVEEAAARKNADGICDAGGRATWMSGDVAQETVANAMVMRCVSDFGRLDFLVQNAYGGGTDRGGSAVKVSPKAFNEGMALLFGAHFLGAKYAVPEMQKAGGGSIVNISSVHGMMVAREAMVYEVGKAADIALTRQMAVDFGPLGVRVNAIAPGHIVTERMKAMWDRNGNPEGYRFFELQYPVRRCGKPEDIANAVAFLCSDEASFITGVLLPVDGGMTLQLQENILMDLKDYVLEHPKMRFPYG